MDTNKLDQIIKINNEIERLNSKMIEINDRYFDNEIKMRTHLLEIDPTRYKKRYQNGIPYLETSELNKDVSSKCSNNKYDNERLTSKLHTQIYDYEKMLEEIKKKPIDLSESEESVILEEC